MGQAVVAFVTLKGDYEGSDDLAAELRKHVSKLIGPIARPHDINFAPGLPKTRSGKIMRRLLKELVATGDVTGNVTTLEDSSVIDALRKQLKKA
jgi:acetyl-CoA synthetase